jgi:hypothetical protein
MKVVEGQMAIKHSRVFRVRVTPTVAAEVAHEADARGMEASSFVAEVLDVWISEQRVTPLRLEPEDANARRSETRTELHTPRREQHEF